MLAGVYRTQKKDGTTYFRSSITFSGKHISLGSFSTEKEAHNAYLAADKLLHTITLAIPDYRKEHTPLTFAKWVSLVNYRDNHIYIKTPIYLFKQYFYYYFSVDEYYIFDTDDLFYYSTRTISRRGGHLFVADYGMQVNILSRYGIKNYAVAGRDYHFVNGNTRDFRYENIQVVNRYHGVSQIIKNGKTIYETKIHWNGNMIVGRYENEIEAAIAYNKAASTLLRKGYIKDYPVNYIEELSKEEYRTRYRDISISSRICQLTSLL